MPTSDVNENTTRVSIDDLQDVHTTETSVRVGPCLVLSKNVIPYRSGTGSRLEAILQGTGGAKVILKCLGSPEAVVDELSIGKVYIVDGVRVESADPRYNKVGNYELMYNAGKSSVCEAGETVEHSIVWETIQDVRDVVSDGVNQSAFHNMIVMISSVGEPKSMILKSGTTKCKRELIVCDESGSMSFTLWGDEVELPGPIGACVTLHQIKSSTYGGGSLDMIGSSCTQMHKEMVDGAWASPNPNEYQRQPTSFVEAVGRICDWWTAEGKRKYAPAPNDVLYHQIDHLDELEDGELVNIAGIVSECGEKVDKQTKNGERSYRTFTLESAAGSKTTVSLWGNMAAMEPDAAQWAAGDVFAARDLKVDKYQGNVGVTMLGRSARVTEGDELDALHAHKKARTAPE